MATLSSEPNKNWQQLTASARTAAAPADLDLRAAIRAEISASPARAAASTPGSLDVLISLFQMRTLQVGLAALAVLAILSCRESLDLINELTFIWHLQGPAISGI